MNTYFFETYYQYTHVSAMNVGSLAQRAGRQAQRSEAARRTYLAHSRRAHAVRASRVAAHVAGGVRSCGTAQQLRALLVGAVHAAGQDTLCARSARRSTAPQLAGRRKR